MTHTLSMFNTGQVTLPKKWRELQGTNKFIAEETKDGLLIRPVTKAQGVVYYENSDGFGIYCEEGLDIGQFKEALKRLDG